MKSLKPLSQVEIASLVDHLRAYIGWYLQDNLGSDDQLGLLFYGGKKAWLWLDLKAAGPMLLPLERIPERFKKHPKPIHNFISTHGRGLMFKDVCLRNDMGRVVEITLASQYKTLILQITLVPHFANVKAWTFDQNNEFKSRKEIYWKKPRPLPEATVAQLPALGVGRSVDEIVQQWLNPNAVTPKSKTSIQEQFRKHMDKQQKILEQLLSATDETEIAIWLKLGEHLKVYGFQGLSASDAKRFKSANLAIEIESAFATVKKLRAKQAGRRARVEDLKSQIANDQQMLDSNLEESMHQRLSKGHGTKISGAKTSTSKGGHENIKYRTYSTENGFVIRVGRSGEENLKLLRASMPWHLWLHMRDQPGSFGIVPKEKQHKVPLETLKELAVHLVRHSLPDKIRTSARGRYDVICTECRFVQPVKGVKPGLVTYRNESTITVDL